MATIKLKNSQVKGKVPLAADLDVGGELAVNHHADDPGIFLKDTAGAVRKIAGVGSITAPDASATAKGIVQLADAAAVTAGTAGRVVDAAQLKAVSDADDWTRTGTTIAPRVAGDVVNISAGAAALPGLTPVGDPDTGIYSPGADQLAISTGGTGRLFVDSSGRVGVGTGSPGSWLTLRQSVSASPDAAPTLIKLENGSDGGAAIEFSNDVAGKAKIALGVKGTGGATGDTFIGFSTSLNTTLSEKLRITSTGLVGIGTTAPAVTLDVANIHGINNSITRPFRLRNYGQLSDTGYGVGMSFFYPNGTTNDRGFEAASIDSSYTAGGNFGNLIFSTNNNTGVAERLRITAAGNIGIGTTSPGHKLAIEDGADTYALVKRTVSGSESALLIGAESGKTVIYSKDNTTGGRALEFTIGTSPAARIDSSGRLLVGTSSDSGGALLQVNGDRIRVATAKTPASATAAGTAGEICWDASYIYVCTATNTWKRTAISTW